MLPFTTLGRCLHLGCILIDWPFYVPGVCCNNMCIFMCVRVCVITSCPLVRISYLSYGSPQGRKLSLILVRFWDKAGTFTHTNTWDAGHNPLLIPGTHSLLGEQGHTSKETYPYVFTPTRESNPGPLGCEPSALTTTLREEGCMCVCVCVFT